METQSITGELISQVLDAARKSPRRRMNHNFHAGPGDNPHRFLNVMLADTYVAPHRHRQPPKAESFIVLDGYVALFCFDDAGAVTGRHLLGRGPLPELPPALAGIAPAWGIDLAPGTWHTLTAVTPHAVCYEVKPGPWDPSTDKEFAAWAPREGDPEAAAYLRILLDQVP